MKVIGLLLTGTLLLIPWFKHQLQSSSLAEADLRIALQPFAINRIGTSPEDFRFGAAIPSTSVRARINRAWGTPRYIVAVELPGKRLGCMPNIVTDLRVYQSDRMVPLSVSANPMYGYTVDCRNYGFVFSLPLGALFTVSGSVVSSGLPQGASVIISDYWSAETKDRFAGVLLWKEVKFTVNCMALTGGLLIGIGISLYVGMQVSQSKEQSDVDASA